jgi:hypothetical protein
MASNRQMRVTVKTLGPRKSKKPKNRKPPAKPKVAKGAKVNKPYYTHLTLPDVLY